MKSLSVPIIAVLLLFFSRDIYAGVGTATFANSNEIIQRANELHDSGSYQQSIALLQTVSRTDPNYTQAIYELALNYFYLNDFERSYKLCKEADFLRYDDPTVYSLMGSNLDHLGRVSEGIVILKKAISRWPYNQNLIYNLGVCYLNAGMPDSAEAVIQQAIIFYPYHTRSHLLLARANYAMGRTTESYLAFLMTILMSPNLGNIKEFEKAISNNLDLTPKSHLFPYPETYNHKKWDDIRYILQSEIAFNKTYEYPYDLDYIFIRQAHILLNHLQYDPSDTTIYNRLYGRFFSELLKNDFFETYIYYSMNSLGNDNVTQWNNDNPGKINAFIKSAQQFFNEGRKYGFLPSFEQKLVCIHHFDDNGTLTSIGRESDAEEIKDGPFVIVSSNGAVSEKGTYNNNLTEGKWLVFWPNGKVKQELNFIEDKLDGTIQTYYPDGSKAWIYHFSKGLKNGILEEYSASGNIIEQYQHENDVLNGPGIYNNYNEGFKKTYYYRNDTLNGKIIETWFNGKPKAEYEIEKGKYQGLNLSWHTNGNPASRFIYKDDLKSGTGITYHFNGQVKDSARYDGEGKTTGSIYGFNRTGKNTSIDGIYKSNVLTGESILFYENGQKRSVLEYRNDTLISINSYNQKGDLLYSQDARGDSLFYKIFYADGTLKREGLLVNNLNQGLWITYNSMGSKIEENYYRDDMLSGPQKTFYPNGTVKEEYQSDSNKIEGIYKSYYQNGHLKIKGNYVHNNNNGEWIWYYSNDSVSSKTFYADGEVTGISQNFYPDGSLDNEEFFNADGKSVRNVSYLRDQKIEYDWINDYGTHIHKRTYPNGTTRAVVNICDNVRHGMQLFYYPNGQLESQTNYIFGKADGVFQRYDHNGNLIVSCDFTMGEWNGLYKTFENNKLEYIAEFENGEGQGKTRSYYVTSGTLRRESMMSDDMRNGFSDYYAPDGTFMYRLRLEEDIIKGYSWKAANGTFVAEIPVKPDTRQIIAYYPNGNISVKFDVYCGTYHGKYLEYYPSGKLMEEREYSYDNQTGIEKEYYPTGVLKALTHYTNDDRTGAYASYHPNGAVKESGSYLCDLKHGVWNVFKDTGEVLEKLIYEYDDMYEIIRN